MSVAEPRPRLWTKDEYYRMADQGLFRGQRVQLVEGEIVEMSPQNSQHATGIRLTSLALGAAFGSGHDVRAQLPLDLGAASEPEPDVAVVTGAPRDYVQRHPTRALLIVEVSDSSLAYDRREKASLYAKAGIEEYWIVNLVDRCLEVHTGPGSAASMPYHHGYASRRVLVAGGTVRALFAPAGATAIAVADLLP